MAISPSYAILCAFVNGLIWKKIFHMMNIESFLLGVNNKMILPVTFLGEGLGTKGTSKQIFFSVAFYVIIKTTQARVLLDCAGKKEFDFFHRGFSTAIDFESDFGGQDMNPLQIWH